MSCCIATVEFRAVGAEEFEVGYFWGTLQAGEYRPAAIGGDGINVGTGIDEALQNLFSAISLAGDHQRCLVIFIGKVEFGSPGDGCGNDIRFVFDYATAEQSVSVVGDSRKAVEAEQSHVK